MIPYSGGFGCGGRGRGRGERNKRGRGRGGLRSGKRESCKRGSRERLTRWGWKVCSERLVGKPSGFEGKVNRDEFACFMKNGCENAFCRRSHPDEREKGDNVMKLNKNGEERKTDEIERRVKVRIVWERFMHRVKIGGEMKIGLEGIVLKSRDIVKLAGMSDLLGCKKEEKFIMENKEIMEEKHFIGNCDINAKLSVEKGQYIIPLTSAVSYNMMVVGKELGRDDLVLEGFRMLKRESSMCIGDALMFCFEALLVRKDNGKVCECWQNILGTLTLWGKTVYAKHISSGSWFHEAERLTHDVMPPILLRVFEIYRSESAEGRGRIEVMMRMSLGIVEYKKGKILSCGKKVQKRGWDKVDEMCKGLSSCMLESSSELITKLKL